MRARYEKVLEDVSRYAPRYMEEMETVFEKSQEMEQKRISFLKQAFLSIHSHLDVTTNESVQAVYNELHQTIMAISEQDDLRWWKNKNGPGMTTHWPQFEVCELSLPECLCGCIIEGNHAHLLFSVLQEWAPERDRLKKSKEQDKVKLQADTLTEKSYSGPGVRVRALYDYSGQEVDELSFKAGRGFPDPRQWRAHAGLQGFNSAVAATGAAEKETLQLERRWQQQGCRQACRRRRRGAKMAADQKSPPLTGTPLDGVSYVPADDWREAGRRNVHHVPGETRLGRKKRPMGSCRRLGLTDR
ncbi:PACN3 protein, partial [Polypterus senegalus]